MLNVLFLCTGNSCRSQMAEGFVNHDFAGKIHAESAGTKPSVLNKNAIKVMEEIGIDISRNTVNSPDDFQDVEFDYIITLCEHARETCPLFLSERPSKRIHMGFPDPALFTGSEEEIVEGFRKVRDDIRKKLLEFFGSFS
ncbi:MAG: arsenate reductase ArsC [Candidatus Eremiobacteraeota bacterium]|nr:arsenate reductase ArsC [Candidatus Eremiobacteraeota bacterium]